MGRAFTHRTRLHAVSFDQGVSGSGPGGWRFYFLVCAGMWNMVLIHRGTLMQTAALFSLTAVQIRLCCVWIARQRIEKLLSFLIVFTHHLQAWDKCCALWDFSYLCVCVCVCVCGCMCVCPGKPYMLWGQIVPTKMAYFENLWRCCWEHFWSSCEKLSDAFWKCKNAECFLCWVGDRIYSLSRI